MTCSAAGGPPEGLRCPPPPISGSVRQTGEEPFTDPQSIMSTSEGADQREPRSVVASPQFSMARPLNHYRSPMMIAPVPRKRTAWGSGTGEMPVVVEDHEMTPLSRRMGAPQPGICATCRLGWVKLVGCESDEGMTDSGNDA